MKMNTKLVTILGAVALATTTAVAKPGGADTLHFSIHTSLTDTGVEAGSSGKVSATEVKTGDKLIQNVTVTVTGLTAETGYTLNAVTGGGTVDLDDFTTDSHGKATLHLRTGNGNGKNTVALPDGFELVDVTELDVVGGSGTVLTTADTTPKSTQYSVKKNLVGDVAAGTVQIKASAKSTKFNLNATGLDANTDYNLFINGTQVQTNTTDSKGRLKIKSAEGLPPNPVDINSVEVQDGGGNVILSATLP